MKTRFASLTILCLALAAIPALAEVLYDNGPINGTSSGWIFSFGFTVSDSFTLLNNSTVGGFEFGAWEYPGDVLSSVEWSITSQENGGTAYGSGTASGKNLTDKFISTNQLGFDIDEITVTGLNVGMNGGTYWLNLLDAQDPRGDPTYWDENSGAGCMSNGCPSTAYELGIGTVPSESFTITGSGSGTTPEPGSFMLLASGVIALAGMLRRKLL
jgi:hypothetical protein